MPRALASSSGSPSTASSARSASWSGRTPSWRTATCSACAGARPFEHPDLGVTLEPLRSLAFTLERVTQAALLGEDGAVVVNVPAPERYALHKLVDYGERGIRYAAKSANDLAQAASLLEVLRARRSAEVESLWRDLTGRGRGRSTRAREGLAALDAYAPDLHAREWLGAGAARTPGRPSAAAQTRTRRRARAPYRG